MRTIAWETAFRIVLRNCSKEVGRKVSIHVILVKEVHAIQHIFFAEGSASLMKVIASHEEQTSP